MNGLMVCLHSARQFRSMADFARCAATALLMTLLGFSPGFAAEPKAPATPDPTEWTNSDQPLEFLTELHFGGANHPDMPPLDHTGQYMIGRIAGGTAVGPKLSGKILPLGEDWAVLRPDGTLEIDVQMIIETEDGAFVRVKYQGRWRGAPDIRQKILAGEDVSPKQYYLRMTPYFSTTSKKYDWLNHIVAVGYGHVQRGVGVSVRIFAVK